MKKLACFSDGLKSSTHSLPWTTSSHLKIRLWTVHPTSQGNTAGEYGVIIPASPQARPEWEGGRGVSNDWCITNWCEVSGFCIFHDKFRLHLMMSRWIQHTDSVFVTDLWQPIHEARCQKPETQHFSYTAPRSCVGVNSSENRQHRDNCCRSIPTQTHRHL